MGYEIHITRAQSWGDEGGGGISEREWRDLVNDDPDLVWSEDGGRDNEGYAIFTGRPSDSEMWLSWSEGNISTKHPDDALLAKMIQIADVLGAQVQGDDGEVYPLSDEAETPLFWETRAHVVALAVTSIALVLFITAAIIESKQAEASTASSWLAVAVLGVPGCLGCIGGAATAALSLPVARENRWAAWSAIGLNVLFLAYLWIAA